MPTDGPLGKARLQAGLPRQRGADRAGHMYAGMLDHLPVQQDRLSVGSRHVSRQLHATLAAARPAEQLPRQLWPGVGGLRAGRGYGREELRGRLPHSIGSPGLRPGVHRRGQAERRRLRV